jgi:6-phosphofructo-2-kinase
MKTFLKTKDRPVKDRTIDQMSFSDHSQNSSNSSLIPSAVRKKDILELKNELGPKYVIFMVGLPARGKSYICKKLCRYLSWCGFKTKVFNVGNKRRLKNTTIPGPNPNPNPNTDNCSKPTIQDSSFFDHSNEDANATREQLAMDSLEDIIVWLKGDGKVAIHDATNSTVARRKKLRDRVLKESKIKPIFIESICPDPILLEKNIEMKLSGPDYIGMDPVLAKNDFKERIKNYERVYETIGEEEEKQGIAYIKIIDVGSKVIANRVKGYLPSQCVFYLMQMVF